MKTRRRIEIQVFTESRLLPEAWNTLLPPDHYLSRKNLKLTEDAGLPDISFVYTLVFMKGKPVAAAGFQVLKLRGYHLDDPQLSFWKKLSRKSFIAVWKPRLLTGGHLFRHDVNAFYWKENLSAFLAFRIYQKAILKTVKISKASAVLLKELPGKLVPYFDHYAPDFLRLRQDISMEMQIAEAWKKPEDYEKSLKHKYAQRFRRIRQTWNNLTIRELNAEDTEKEKAEIFRLYRQVAGHQKIRVGILNEGFIPALKRNNPERLKIWLVREADKPVAFFSAWTQEHALDMFYIGFDYERNEALSLYFNILFFAIEEAIRQKKEKLILGRTALEAKARIGCRPRYLSTYLFIRNSFLRKIVFRLQQSVFSEEGAWERRHPFKKNTSNG